MTLRYDLTLVLSLGFIFSCLISASQEMPAQKGEKTRADVLAEIKQLDPQFQNNPDDKEIRFQYGKLLYQSGEFWQARDVIAKLALDAEPSVEAISLAAELEYLLANYEEAEKLYKRLVKAKEGDMAGQVMAKVGLMLTYYQTNQYNKAKEIEFPPGVILPNWEQMKSFEESPYQVKWHNEERVSIVPFLMTDPLPILTLSFNGIPVHVIFDTGADMFILDNEIAAEMGIEWVSKAMGSFGGGKKSEVGFGKVESVKIGDVTLKQVPVTILPTKRFSAGFEKGKYTLGGFIGTAALKQFLSMLDYKNDRLILRERTEESVRKLREELKDRISTEVNFVLKATHMMMTRGSLNDKDDLTYFVDSGLASMACFSAPIQTLEYVGIPVPETRVREDSIGGGGGRWASGSFPIKTIGLGPLTQSKVIGEYGSRPPESYWSLGFIQDGLISHRFLRQYSSWTLDFDSMKYIFEK
jgi:tetratricopeptide (TPR) repeat protein